MSKSKVLVLSNSYEPLSITCRRKAFLLVYLDKADVVEFKDELMHTINKSYNVPSIIRLKQRPKFNIFSRVELNRKNIFKRDNHQCQYCGSNENLTIDHIIPKSKGGDSTWENLVTACTSCNNKKDNKLLNEVNMKLKSTPKRPHHVQFLMKRQSVEESWKDYLFLR